MITEAQITAAVIELYGDDVSGNRRKPMRAILEAAEKAAWQPIETAPKDGTRVLIWRDNGTDPTKGYFVDRQEYGGWFDDSEVQTWRIFPPTHWRPLPEPPTESA